MIKQHPFVNGNKRIASVSLMVFLRLNGKWIETGWRNLYEVAKMVADSDAKQRDAVIDALEITIKKTMTDWDHKKVA